MAEGYGTDVSLTDKLVTGRLVTGRALVIEAWFRRLITPRGTLASDLTYGFDLSGYVGAVGTDRALYTVGGMAANELSKDDRAHNIKCTTLISDLADGTKRLELSITGTLVDTDEDLSLTLAITDVTTTILVSS